MVSGIVFDKDFDYGRDGPYPVRVIDAIADMQRGAGP